MAEQRAGGAVGVLATAWGDPYDEPSFVLRSLAGALSRLHPVDVLVPGPAGAVQPDGAFDLTGAGQRLGAGPWPVSTAWPDARPPEVVVTDADDEQVAATVRRALPGVHLVVLAAGAAVPDWADSGWRVAPAPEAPAPEAPADLPTTGPRSPQDVGLHVPVSSLAARHRHNGLGFTGYLLVLTDRRSGEARRSAPTSLAAWLAARFPRRDLVLVEDAVASVWRSRALRGHVAVDSRTDLWRLVAHASAVVDLHPGPLVARECVESLRYGVPVVVPAGTPAADLAARGGGLWYRDVAELLGCVAALDDGHLRDTLGAQGRRFTDDAYGNPDRFVARVAAALGASGHGG